MQSTNGNWTVTPDFPDDELVVAAAARFRQLNNQGEPTAFTTASDLVIKAANVTRCCAGAGGGCSGGRLEVYF